MDLKDRLREARKTRGWTQEQLAQEADLSRSLVAKLEEGSRTNIQLESARCLAAALDCSLAWLLDGEGDGPTTKVA